MNNKTQLTGNEPQYTAMAADSKYIRDGGIVGQPQHVAMLDEHPKRVGEKQPQGIPATGHELIDAERRAEFNRQVAFLDKHFKAGQLITPKHVATIMQMTNYCVNFLADDKIRTAQMDRLSHDQSMVLMAARAQHEKLQELLQRTARDRRIFENIDILRGGSGLGDSVTLLCPNEGDNDQPANVVECDAEWTGWTTKRFGGNTLEEALQAAVDAKAKAIAAVNDDFNKLLNVDKTNPPADVVETPTKARCNKCNGTGKIIYPDPSGNESPLVVRCECVPVDQLP